MKNISEVIFSPVKESDDRTVFIRNIPRKKRNARQLKEFIESKFDGTEVTGVTFVYDVEALKSLSDYLDCIDHSLIFCEKFKNEYGYRYQVNTYCIGRCCCCLPTTDGLTFYEDQRTKYDKLIQDEAKSALSDPKHSVFVQFKNESQAIK